MAIEKLITDEGYYKYPTDTNPTTDQEWQTYLKNLHGTAQNLVDAQRLWQPSTELALNEIVRSPSMPANTVAKVTTPGITGMLEPSWTAQGSAVTDNSVTYLMIRHCQEAATADEAKAGADATKYITPNTLRQVLQAYLLTIYPVGYVYTSSSSISPATLFGGTWAAMKPGLVLVSAGTADTGTIYTAGATGGEEKHQLTVEEMASHNHSASGTAQSAGAHTHTYGGSDDTTTDPRDGLDLESNHKLNISNRCTTSEDGAHTHDLTITINNTGNSQSHNTLQPYEVIYRWRRTA